MHDLGVPVKKEKDEVENMKFDEEMENNDDEILNNEDAESRKNSRLETLDVGFFILLFKRFIFRIHIIILPDLQVRN